VLAAPPLIWIVPVGGVVSTGGAAPPTAVVMSAWISDGARARL
jgi:hypothetical protein